MTPDDRILAAELALGLLDEAERVAALERVLAEPALAEEVAWWRTKLAPILAEYASAEPSADLRERIEALMTERSGETAGPRRRWPAVAGGAMAGALAASLAWLLVAPTSTPPAPITQPVATPTRVLLVAPLAPTEKGEQAPVAVVVDHDARAMRIVGVITVPEGRSAELWRIGADGVPLALGVLHRGRVSEIDLSSVNLPRVRDTIAVSIEPEGGAPGNAPTGPVVATGVLSPV